METNKLEWKEDEARYCAYCNNITLQDLFSDGTQIIWICKSCNMEAAQLILFPGDTKKEMEKHFNKLRTGY